MTSTRPRPLGDLRVARFFRGGELLVDLGCGDGTWLDAVSPLYQHAIGFDIDVTGITRRAGPVSGWEFRQADLNDGIPLPESSADGIHANQVIEHIANPRLFLEECHRALRPGAVVIITTPNIRYIRHLGRLVLFGLGPLTSSGQLRTRDEWDDGHIHFFTSRDLEWLARTAGFGRYETRALVDLHGQGRLVRHALDRVSSAALVKGFLTGNILLAAWK